MKIVQLSLKTWTIVGTPFQIRMGKTKFFILGIDVGYVTRGMKTIGFTEAQMHPQVMSFETYDEARGVAQLYIENVWPIEKAKLDWQH